MACFNLALIGGDTVRGPLSLTLTVQGLVAAGRAVRRSGAGLGDRVYVTGPLGAAGLAVAQLGGTVDPALMACLLRPKARVDFVPLLLSHASAAIDLSDGFSADLQRLCQASGLGACLDLAQLPIHPLVVQQQPTQALDFALSGGDDYEVCFTIPAEREQAFTADLKTIALQAYPVGWTQQEPGLRALTSSGALEALIPKGYNHFA